MNYHNNSLFTIYNWMNNFEYFKSTKNNKKIHKIKSRNLYYTIKFTKWLSNCQFYITLYLSISQDQQV